MASVKNGSVLLYYSFDVAYEIELSKLEKIFGKAPKEAQLKTERLAPPYIQYSSPPLLVNLGQSTLTVTGSKLACNVRAKIYDFGVVTIVYQAAIENKELKELAALSDALYDDDNVDQQAIAQMEKLAKETSEAFVKPHAEIKTFENYVIFHARTLDKKTTAEELLKKQGNEIAHIVSAESQNLSQQEARDALRSAYSYYENDLAVIDWPAAFIYDDSDSWEAFDVLEYANIELLELRTYDAILDKELDEIYDEMQKPPRVHTILGEYGAVLKRVGALRVDTVSVIEKVENSLKLIGDAYLAKLYDAASDRFKLRQWKQSVDKKLDVAEDMYTILSDRINNQNMLVLEIAVVALFILDIVLYVFKII
ncbi:MAG TPA: hypothetical protein VGQ00_00620 [Candidatus Norongarragalinales archaeon]|jgi:hypothetical protein|nr:hypothetical protein [Candidatus Norongarragalinales archaeon]